VQGVFAADEASTADCAINASSGYRLIASPMPRAWCAFKFAVRGFSDALRQAVAYLGNNIQVACALPADVKTAIAQRAKGGLYAKSEHTQVLECEKMQAWFCTSAEQAATDILVGVTKGKIKIHVGRGTGWFDWLSRLLPVSYSRLF